MNRGAPLDEAVVGINCLCLEASRPKRDYLTDMTAVGTFLSMYLSEQAETV